MKLLNDRSENFYFSHLGRKHACCATRWLRHWTQNLMQLVFDTVTHPSVTSHQMKNAF
jgi:hypothetical protein